MGDAALESDGVVLGAPRRFTAAAGIAALAVLHHLGGTLQGTDLADSGNIFAIPLDLELEILIGIEALCIYAKLSHEFASLVSSSHSETPRRLVLRTLKAILPTHYVLAALRQDAR